MVETRGEFQGKAGLIEAHLRILKLSPVRITRIIFWIASSYSFVWGQIFSRKNILACATLCASTSRLSRIASTKYSRAYILVLKTSVRFKSPLIFTWKSLCDLLSFGSLDCGCVFGGGGDAKLHLSPIIVSQ